MTTEQQIMSAAELIQAEMIKLEMPVPFNTCVSIARQLFSIWTKPGGPQRFIPQGDVAQHFRARHVAAGMIENPLLDPEQSICGGLSHDD